MMKFGKMMREEVNLRPVFDLSGNTGTSYKSTPGHDVDLCAVGEIRGELECCAPTLKM